MRQGLAHAGNDAPDLLLGLGFTARLPPQVGPGPQGTAV
jgi:hypothetical protein